MEKSDTFAHRNLLLWSCVSISAGDQLDAALHRIVQLEAEVRILEKVL